MSVSRFRHVRATRVDVHRRSRSGRSHAPRRRLLGVAVVVALVCASLVVVTANPAVAHGTWAGTFTVRASGAASAVVAVGNGDDVDGDWCGSTASGLADAAPSGGTVTVAVDPGPACGRPTRSKLPSATYEVAITNGYVYGRDANGTYTWLQTLHCTHPGFGSAPRTSLGSVVVDSAGYAPPATFNLPNLQANGTGQFSSVCLLATVDGETFGIEAPVHVSSLAGGSLSAAEVQGGGSAIDQVSGHL